MVNPTEPHVKHWVSTWTRIKSTRGLIHLTTHVCSASKENKRRTEQEVGENERVFGRGVEESDISFEICNGAVPSLAGETREVWVCKFTKKEDWDSYSFATEKNNVETWSIALITSLLLLE